MMLKYEGFGTSHPDPNDPELKTAAHSFIFERAADGHVRLHYKHFMHDTELLPTDAGPTGAEGHRVFKDDDFCGECKPHERPELSACPITAMACLAESIPHIRVGQ